MMQLHWLIIVSCFSVLIAPSAWADLAEHRKDTSHNLLTERLRESQHPQRNNEIPHLHDIAQPAKTVEQWLSQTPSVIEVTGVSVSVTDFGLDVILDTSAELAPVTSVIGNTLIVDIPNAVLALPNAQDFQQIDPVAEIASVSVTNLPNNYVRVAITGVDAPPTAEVIAETQSLVLSVTPGLAEAEEEIQIVVTGEQETGYFVPDASTATRTDTPVRDIPQSIQVVPQQMLRDQQATRLIEALQNSPGVFQGGVSPRTYGNNFSIRGFNSFDQTLVNGLPDPTVGNVGFGANVERVEILKGPASVLYGQGGLGGRVNLVTKQPLRNPFYAVEGSAGSYNFYRGAIDLSGLLNSEGTVLYRLNAAAQTTESFVDFYEQQRYLIAPVVSWLISDRTTLTLETEYSAVEGPIDVGIPAQGSVLPNPNGEIPRERNIGEPDVDNSQQSVFRVGFDLEHRFSDNWQMRSVFRTSLLRLNREIVFSRGAGALQSDGRTLNRIFDDQDYNEDIYNLDTYAVGNFATGSIQHQLVAGINLFRYDTNTVGFTRSIASLDVFEPEYGASPTGSEIPDYDITNRTQQLGLYLQDLISLTDNFKLLLGGRFDIASQRYRDATENFGSNDDFKQEEAFSPRVGIVYQPIQAISLYASYSRSFNQATSTFSAAQPEPERGNQFEIGVRADLANRLAATLAFYDLTRSNLPTADPNNPLLTIQVGEQRSRGIELDFAGEILPGWNILAGYAYTDATITEDNDFEVGNRLNNVPQHAINLWTTYEIQSGAFQGLGFGLGIFYFGERQGDLANTFELPSYIRTDAALFYNRNNFRAALNIRNLFDIDYFVTAQNRARVFPGDPLTFVGTVSWEF